MYNALLRNLRDVKPKQLCLLTLRTLYVTGLLLSENVEAQIVQPLNHAVLFLKETDVVLSSDVWRVMLHVDLSTYHNVISTV